MGSIRQRTTAARRQLLIDSAIACFLEDGIAVTSVRDIAGRAGVSLGNLYNHFSGIDALIEEVARIESREIDHFIPRIMRRRNPATAFASFIGEYLTICADPYHAVLSVQITAASLHNPAIAGMFDTNRARLVACLSSILSDAVAQSLAPRDLDVANTSELILDLVEAAGQRIGLSGHRPGRKQRRALLRLTSEKIIG